MREGIIRVLEGKLKPSLEVKEVTHSEEEEG